MPPVDLEVVWKAAAGLLAFLGVVSWMWKMARHAIKTLDVVERSQRQLAEVDTRLADLERSQAEHAAVAAVAADRLEQYHAEATERFAASEDRQKHVLREVARLRNDDSRPAARLHGT